MKLTKPEKAVLVKAAEILKELSQLASNENDRTNAGLGSNVCVFFAIDEQKPEQPEKPVDLDPTIAKAMDIDSVTGEEIARPVTDYVSLDCAVNPVAISAEGTGGNTTSRLSDPFARKNDPVLV